MKFISHRGNINGRLDNWENEPTYIDLAISKGYDVEVDVWMWKKLLFLGHDKPDYGLNMDWFARRTTNLWIHCKNIEAVEFFHENFHYNRLNFFWHQEDTLTLTSLGYIWAFPGKQPIKNSISVLPELNSDDISSSIGVCSDYIEKYKNDNLLHTN